MIALGDNTHRHREAFHFEESVQLCLFYIKNFKMYCLFSFSMSYVVVVHKIQLIIFSVNILHLNPKAFRSVGAAYFQCVNKESYFKTDPTTQGWYHICRL